MQRLWTKNATGIAPDGRLFAGDINALQDAVAAANDLTQTIALGTLQIGETGLQLLRYGAGIARLTGSLRLDGSLGITSSLFSGLPPVSPNDGDIWIANVNTTTGIKWVFQYRSASASPYKWEFIGGAPLYTLSSGAVTCTALASWQSLGGSLTAIRDGDYGVRFGAGVAATQVTANDQLADLMLGVAVGNTTPSQPIPRAAMAGGSSSTFQPLYQQLASRAELLAVGIGAVLTLRYQVNGSMPLTAQQFSQRWMEIVPIRVN